MYEGIPEERRARVRDVLAQDGFAHATAESAAMFSERLGVQRVDRTLVVTPLGRVVILDELEAEGPREWTYLLHSDWPTTQLDPDGWRLESGPASARLTRLLPTDATATRHRTVVEANPTSSTPSLKVSKAMHTLRLTTPRARTATFLTVLDSTGSLDPRPDPAVLLASDQGHAVSVGQGDEKELVLLAPRARVIETGRVSADAAAIVLSGTRVAAVRARRVDIDGAVALRSTSRSPAYCPPRPPARREHTMKGWERGALRAMEFVAQPALAGAAFCLLALGVVTWLPALAAAAIALQDWRRDGGGRPFTGTLRAFPRCWHALWKDALAASSLIAVLATNCLFLLGRGSATAWVLLPVQFALLAALAVYALSLAAAAAVGTDDGFRRRAAVLAFASPRRSLVLLLALLLVPPAMLPVPLGPPLLGPTVPLLLALSLHAPLNPRKPA